ncbi:MAG: prepilin peptidase [Fimbriimonadaceae bacterium]|nr:prepilin peptidase [Fimbriimonadaceae bacterium]
MILPAWSWAFGFLLGAIIGSFLNVVIYRVPRGKSLSNPPNSFCPRCEHGLGPADLIPLLSWLMQRGRCRYCHAPVAPRYFLVELLNAAIWAAIWHQYLQVAYEPGKAVAYLLAASTLVAIIFIDWELYIIPDQINAFLLFVGIGLNVWQYAQGSPAATINGLPSALVGAVVGVGTIWGIALFGLLLFKKDAMGHGDIKMARGIGAVLLPQMALVSFGLAVFAGAILGVVQVALRSAATSRGSGAEVATGGEGPDEPDPEPESVASLIKCGLGYLLCLDVIGLAVPIFYEGFFGENPYSVEDIGDEEVERTMIPFGPYLAIGAIGAVVFEGPLRSGLDAYLRWVGGGSP